MELKKKINGLIMGGMGNACRRGLTVINPLKGGIGPSDGNHRVPSDYHGTAGP